MLGTSRPEPTTPRSPRRLRSMLILSDAVSGTVGFGIALVLQWRIKPVPPDVVFEHAALASFSLVAMLLVMGVSKLFTARVCSRPGEEIRRLCFCVAAGVSSSIALTFLLRYRALSRFWVGLSFVCVVGCLLVSRSIARAIFARLRRTGRIRRRVVIVGTGVDAIALVHTTQRHPELGYEIVGFVGDENIGQRGGLRVLGSVADITEIVRRTNSTGAILSLASLEAAVVNQLTRSLPKCGCHVTLSSSLRDIDISRTRAQEFDGRLMIYVEPNGNRGWTRWLQRVFDVSVAVLALLLSLPILIVAAVAIKAESSGPIVFSQVRVGRNGRRFRIYKLRTMVQDAEGMRRALQSQNEVDGPLFKMRDDPRVTRVGRFLRKSSIDELPQLWNVVRGEMSIVGPRPALPEESDQWSAELHERSSVKPGITGMWQVSGRSDSDFEQYQRLDLYYVDNWSLVHDLRIVLKTFVVVLAGRGAQ